MELKKFVNIIVLALLLLILITVSVFLFRDWRASQRPEEAKEISAEVDNSVDGEEKKKDQPLLMVYDTLPDNDKDSDGLTDEEEQKLGTDKEKADTDNDNLSDKIEVEQTKTDPTKADTDGDGYGDGLEIFYGHDPLK
ncbi:MAG TPA: hypothetical protein VJB37_00210 [Patescibacteria group bacterium]|nr:hypothetical protein [Patescibacteria group bacterium]